jgi:hypothetical protein
VSLFFSKKKGPQTEPEPTSSPVFNLYFDGGPSSIETVYKSLQAPIMTPKKIERG